MGCFSVHWTGVRPSLGWAVYGASLPSGLPILIVGHFPVLGFCLGTPPAPLGPFCLTPGTLQAKNRLGEGPALLLQSPLQDRLISHSWRRRGGGERCLVN